VLGDPASLLPKFFAEHKVFAALATQDVDDDLLDGSVCIRHGCFVGFGGDFEVDGEKALARNGVSRVGQLERELQVLVEGENASGHAFNGS
jgi:hypothetical protein